MTTIDLNKAKGRETIEITVEKKRFRIVRVVTGVRQIYADYMQKSAEALSGIETIDQFDGESESDHIERLNRITESVNSFTKEREEIYFKMLDLILSRNGYSLDQSWWLKNTDEFDRQQFIEICLTKDSPNVKKKMTGSGLTMKS